jgi:hypothetical protein
MSRKINGHTVRGGWSRNSVYGEVDGLKFSLWAKDTFGTSLSKVRQFVKKIESKKVVLPKALDNSNLYFLMPDNSIEAFK